MVKSEGDKPPVQRVKNLDHDKECLKYPGFECNCVWADKVLRKKKLRELREKEGLYSFVNLMDPGSAEQYNQERKTLCEGKPPSKWEIIKYNLSRGIRFV